MSDEEYKDDGTVDAEVVEMSRIPAHAPKPQDRKPKKRKKAVHAEAVDGYLSITGRKKEIIVTAGGKNVAPAVLEDRVRSHPLVSQVVVVGDAKPFIAALLTLDPEALGPWLAARGLPELTLAEAKTNPDVLAALDQAVQRANKAVSRAESIRKFTILDGDFTVENDYLTPSLKVKRNLVLRDYTETVEELYRGVKRAE